MAFELPTPRLTQALQEVATDAYRLQLFSGDECQRILQHIEAESLSGDAPMEAPNSMQEYGMVIKGADTTAWISALANTHLRSMIQNTFSYLPTPVFSSFYAFITHYAMDKNRDLSLHVDRSHITINICLSNESINGELTFTGARCADHLDTAPDVAVGIGSFSVGEAVVHAGNQRHFVTGIEEGSRTNLVIWAQMEGWDIRHNDDWVKQRCAACS
ncbi:MAG: hypothetical protein AB8C02_15460 [Halioglobus sp.]